jgi:hypothetical protein
VANAFVVLVPVPSLKSAVASPSVSQAWLATVPSGSVDVEVNVKLWPVGWDADAGSIPNAAVGPRLATVIVRVDVLSAPRLSVTRSLTEYVPGIVKVRDVLAAVPSLKVPSASSAQA